MYHQSDQQKNEKEDNQYHSQKENSMQKQQQQIKLVRMPFSCKSKQTLSKVLSKQTVEKINQKQAMITVTANINSSKSQFSVNLFKKKLIRPMQRIKTKKMINKKTGKTIKIVKKAEEIGVSYDYQQLGDFLNSMGSQFLYGTKRYSFKQQDILNLIRKQLQTNVFKTSDQSQNEPQASNSKDEYLKLIQPLNYLKTYNFVPPLCDMLINKIKPSNQQTVQVSGKSISYEDQIPQPLNAEAPKIIIESQLYSKVVSYLEKRPCWLKNSLYYALYQDGMKGKFTINDFKNVMKYLAFTYRNGPWKHTFCKFGFDPKKQFKSLIYQSITIKIKDKQVEDYGNEAQEEVYDPTFQQFSNRFIRSYQLCDIVNETIRQIVQGKLISKEGECTKQHGWLNNTEHSKIMKIMKNKLNQNSK